jgi:hypothetical protein
MNREALAKFTTEATTALRGQCIYLFRQVRHDNFILDLKTHLTHVESRLERSESLLEGRLLDILSALERLARVRDNQIPYATAN